MLSFFRVRGLGLILWTLAIFWCQGNVPAQAQAPGRLYVDDSATGAATGASWANAFPDLQSALAAARVAGSGVREVWVAEGTYRPAGAGGDRTLSFDMVEGVALYGGFAGTESSLVQRNLAAGHVSALSGDLNGNDGADFAGNGENSCHVVTVRDITTSPTLDGFTITGGYASGEATGGWNAGGGVFIAGGASILRHCAIQGNSASTGDGGRDLYDCLGQRPH